jgi:hypothetical protein
MSLQNCLVSGRYKDSVNPSVHMNLNCASLYDTTRSCDVCVYILMFKINYLLIILKHSVISTV